MSLTWAIILEPDTNISKSEINQISFYLKHIIQNSKFKFKNILFDINTKAHTLTNGESETQQGFIWLNAHNYIVR